MLKDKFVKLEESLIKRGYKKYPQHWNREDYVIGKEFHKNDNKFEEDRSAYQILLSIYDYGLRYGINLSDEERKRVGIIIHLDVSRTSSELFEMTFSWDDDTDIEKIEEIAESFYQFISDKIKEPKY